MAGIGIYELIVVLVLMSILATPFWIISVIDILRSRFEGNNKIVWLLVVTFLSIPGIMLYGFIGKKQKIKIQ